MFDDMLSHKTLFLVRSSSKPAWFPHQPSICPPHACSPQPCIAKSFDTKLVIMVSLSRCTSSPHCARRWTHSWGPLFFVCYCRHALSCCCFGCCWFLLLCCRRCRRRYCSWPLLQSLLMGLVIWLRLAVLLKDLVSGNDHTLLRAWSVMTSNNDNGVIAPSSLLLSC